MRKGGLGGVGEQRAETHIGGFPGIQFFLKFGGRGRGGGCLLVGDSLTACHSYNESKRLWMDIIHICHRSRADPVRSSMAALRARQGRMVI